MGCAKVFKFFYAHKLWFYGLGGIVALYAAYRFMASAGGDSGASQGPTAADIAAQGTVAPGTSVYAATGGGVYADPNAATNAALISGLLNSGPTSTAPSNQGPVTSIPNAAAIGTAVAPAPGTMADPGLSPNSTASTAITMPSLAALLPTAIPVSQPGSTLSAVSAPAAIAGGVPPVGVIPTPPETGVMPSPPGTFWSATPNPSYAGVLAPAAAPAANIGTVQTIPAVWKRDIGVFKPLTPKN